MDKNASANTTFILIYNVYSNTKKSQNKFTKKLYFSKHRNLKISPKIDILKYTLDILFDCILTAF